jgi:cation diffusion facilitator CzcD-associated flavoprotein CzcO
MPHNIRRVAVIGAGPAGAIATDALVKEGAFDTIRVFDRRVIVGGTWYDATAFPP